MPDVPETENSALSHQAERSIGGVLTEPAEPLFRDRVPEAAARQLAVVLAWLTECNLATLESMELRKSTSKYELKRHRSICNDAVAQCVDLNIEPRGLYGKKCPRLAELLREKPAGSV